MFLSLALIFLVGMLLGSAAARLKLPGLIGMLAAGILLGPHALNLIDGSVMSMSAELRRLALIIIIMRAGLSLDIRALRRVGRPAALLCFVPATFEIAGMVLLAPRLLGISVVEAAIMGSVVAAVSPAVVVPRMLKLMDEGYGVNKSIPQMIMVGASVDDVFVIVLFTSFTSLAGGGAVSPALLAGIPISIVLGVLIGALAGWLMSGLFKRIQLRDSAKALILLSAALILVAAEDSLGGIIPFSGLLAVMAAGAAMLRANPALAVKMSAKFSKIWVAAEILLFVLVGATVDISYAANAGARAVILLLLVLAFRMIGVLVCLIRTSLNWKERAFCMVAYIPKATVQAAIGGIPLAMGLDCGNIVLTVAVLSIMITAPLGALGVDLTYKKWLSRSDK